MVRQFDSMVRNQYSDAKSLKVAVPVVQGRVLVNSAYKLTDGGALVQRRYTYFMAGRTAFVVQCTAPPASWAAVQGEFDAMLASLNPGGTAAKQEIIGDAAAVQTLKDGVPVLVDSWPSAWRCSAKAVRIAGEVAGEKRELQITLAFQRSDIGRVYDATKMLFGMTKAGKGDELDKLPGELQEAAASSSDFVKNVGQVWGYAYSVVLNCDPPIERYRIIVADSAGRRVGSVTVSAEDASAILTGKVTASDPERVASMYEFE